MEDKRYWVGFNLVRGIGAVRFQKLIQSFGDLETAWNADRSELLSAGLGTRLVERCLQARSQFDLQKIWEGITSQGIHILTWADENYPARLREIEQPPPVLYIRGEYLQDDLFAVAVVGTRRITQYGRQITEELGTFLAVNGITVVSGLARGVDSAAHSSALKAGGRTIAVLGSGVDRIYPPEHRELATQIISRGALISDYAPGTEPESSNFPPRNRIISGLSLAVVIVEAGETSGALITAGFAAEQGREVFAVPGSVLAPQSKGTNRLIQTGAQPLLTPEDLLQTLHLSNPSEQKSARRLMPVDNLESQILKIMGDEPAHVDELRNRSGLPIEQVSAALVLLELKGLVRQVGGMNYVSVREVQSDYNG